MTSTLRHHQESLYATVAHVLQLFWMPIQPAALRLPLCQSGALSTCLMHVPPYLCTVIQQQQQGMPKISIAVALACALKVLAPCCDSSCGYWQTDDSRCEARRFLDQSQSP